MKASIRFKLKAINRFANRVTLVALLVYISLMVWFHFPKTTFNSGVLHLNIDKEIKQHVIRAEPEIISRLKRSEFYSDAFTLKMTIASHNFQYIVMVPYFPRSFGAAYPFFNYAFIAPIDAQTGEIIAGARTKLQPATPSLEDVIAHEGIHLMVNKALGSVKARLLPTWKYEGYAEHISPPKHRDAKKMLADFCEGTLEDSGPSDYFLYRLAVGHLMEAKGMTGRDVFESDLEFYDVLSEVKSLRCL